MRRLAGLVALLVATGAAVLAGVELGSHDVPLERDRPVPVSPYLDRGP